MLLFRVTVGWGLLELGVSSMAISGANVPEGKCPASVRIMTLIAHAHCWTFTML